MLQMNVIVPISDVKRNAFFKSNRKVPGVYKAQANQKILKAPTASLAQKCI